MSSRKAYQLGYLKEEAPWISMIQDRNLSAHVYDENSAKEIIEKVRTSYHPALIKLGALLQN